MPKIRKTPSMKDTFGSKPDAKPAVKGLDKKEIAKLAAKFGGKPTSFRHGGTAGYSSLEFEFKGKRSEKAWDFADAVDALASELDPDGETTMGATAYQGMDDEAYVSVSLK